MGPSLTQFGTSKVLDISEEVFQTLMANFDKGGTVSQLVKNFRDGNLVKHIPV